MALRSDPDTVVPIIGVMAGTAETRYQVFQNNRQATYYESQLRPLEPADETSLLSADASACALYRARSLRALSVSPRCEIDPGRSAAPLDCRRGGRG